METEQLEAYAQKSVHWNLRTFLLALVLAVFSLFVMTGRSSAVMTCMAGVMIAIDAYSFKASAAMLDQLNVPKPRWLEWARYSALVGGPVFVVTGLWLLFRR